MPQWMWIDWSVYFPSQSAFMWSIFLSFILWYFVVFSCLICPESKRLCWEISGICGGVGFETLLHGRTMEFQLSQHGVNLGAMVVREAVGFDVYSKEVSPPCGLKCTGVKQSNHAQVWNKSCTSTSVLTCPGVAQHLHKTSPCLRGDLPKPCPKLLLAKYRTSHHTQQTGPFPLSTQTIHLEIYFPKYHRTHMIL